MFMYLSMPWVAGQPQKSKFFYFGGGRDDFVVRLKNAVAWVNKNRHDELLYLSHNQKERAQDVLNLEGCRTKW